MSRFTIDRLSAAQQTEAMAQLHPAKATDTPAAPRKAGNRARIRQNRHGLNKTEQAFHDWLCNEWPGQRFHSQSVTLQIANGVRFTPDEFTCFANGGCTAWEVKGFMRDDAAVKLKVAARVYPWITFFLVTRQTKKQGGGWNVEGVLP